jgi:hypothetical protein
MYKKRKKGTGFGFSNGERLEEMNLVFASKQQQNPNDRSNFILDAFKQQSRKSLYVVIRSSDDLIPALMPEFFIFPLLRSSHQQERISGYCGIRDIISSGRIWELNRCHSSPLIGPSGLPLETSFHLSIGYKHIAHE